MRLRVVMGVGDHPSNQEIIDEYCTTEPVCRERGRNHLSRYGVDKVMYEMGVPYRNLPLPGAVVEVHDSELAESFRSKLVGWAMVARAQRADAPATVECSVTIERPLL